MVAETSMSWSKSLAAESEDIGLCGQRQFEWGVDMPPSPPSSSMCSSRPAGKENRGEAQRGTWDRLGKGEATGLMEEEAGG